MRKRSNSTRHGRTSGRRGSGGKLVKLLCVLALAGALLCLVAYKSPGWLSSLPQLPSPPQLHLPSLPQLPWTKPSGDDDPTSPGAPLVATFLDVGQGDSAFLSLPDGSTLLIDGSDYKAGPQIVAWLRSQGIQRVDHVLATHPHADHIGGLIDVLASVEVGTVWLPDVDADTATSNEFLDAIELAGCSVKEAKVDEEMAAGQGFSVRLLWPPPGLDSSDLNDYSALALVTCGDKTMLFTGDASARITADACIDAGVGHVDVLKVAHHGGEAGTSQELARLLTPTYAVISYGQDNYYGHPTQEALDALAEVGTQVYGTAVNGNVTVTIDGSQVNVATERDGTVTAGTPLT